MKLNKILFLPVLVFFSWSAYALDSFKTDDIYHIKSVSLSDVSHDGGSLIFITSQADKKEDNFNSRLYILDIKSGKKEVLLQSQGGRGLSFSSVKFSGDSKSIYFLSSGYKASGKNNTQVWSLNLSNRIKRRLTNFDGNINEFTISNDGDTIAFIGNKKSEDQDKIKTPSPIAIDRYQFKRDYEGFLGNDRDHLFVFNTKSRKTRQITSGQRDHSYPSFSPDGKSIAYVTKEGDFDRHNNWDIFIKNIEDNGDVKQLTFHDGPDSSPDAGSRPQWSPDGTKIAYIYGGEHSMLWYALNEVSVLDVETGETDFVTKVFDRNTYMPKWSENGEKLYFILEDNMKSQLVEYSFTDKTFEKITPEIKKKCTFSEKVHFFRVVSI